MKTPWSTHPYIHTLKDGWTYLACVLDLCLHKVIGYTYDRHMTAEMATRALKNTTLNVKDTTGIIIHSDLGSQYTSQEFESYVAEKICYIPLAVKEILMIMHVLNRFMRC